MDLLDVLAVDIQEARVRRQGRTDADQRQTELRTLFETQGLDIEQAATAAWLTLHVLSNSLTSVDDMRLAVVDLLPRHGPSRRRISMHGAGSGFDSSWTVLASHQVADASRCVDVFERPNGTFGFEEFRRDPEDLGAWTPLGSFVGREYPSRTEAVEAARDAVPWLGSVLPD